MFSKFTEMTRHFAEMMEQHRKEQLMAKKKTAWSALSFDSPPPPPKSRKFPMRFTPERNAAEIISATQADDDFERDSLASQSSRTTARVRLQEKFVIIETILKVDCTPGEISERIRHIATDSMAKSGVYEDIDPEDKPFGGFKRNNVSHTFDSFLDTTSLMYLLFCSNTDPCLPRTRLSGMCIRFLIDTTVTAMLHCPSRLSRTGSKSPLLVSTIPPVTLWAVAFCPESRGALLRALLDPPRTRLAAKFTPIWRTSVPASEFRLTAEANKLSRGLFGLSGKR
jgi:hypothetical protein